MGYVLSSIFSVSPNDQHSYFIYFVPGDSSHQRLSTRWIGEWVHSNFSTIAASLGPNGVVISAPPHQRWEETELYELQRCFDRSSGSGAEFLHSHMPFLILSRTPLRPSAELMDTVAINLSMFSDEKGLSLLFDDIIEGIRRDDWKYIIDNYPAQERAVGPWGQEEWLEALNGTIEIKPNIFGIGINVNNAIAHVLDRINQRRPRK